jgi:hypothetical protein
LESFVQPAFLTFQDLGIKVTVEKSKTLQARAYLKKAMFSDWSMRDSGELENVVIQINLTILLQCLTIFGSNAHLELTLQEEGDPLSLMYYFLFEHFSIPFSLLNVVVLNWSGWRRAV